jgi:glycosyltransferase involved in cell wall biosynthesis
MAIAFFLAPSAYPFGGVADWLDYLLPGLELRGWRCILGLVQGRHHDVDSYLARHPWHAVVRIANPTGSAQGRIVAITNTLHKVRPDLVAVVNIVSAYEAIRRMRGRGEATPRVAMTLHGLQSDLLCDVSRESDVLNAVVATNQLAVTMARKHLRSRDRVLYASYGVPVQAESPQPESRGGAPFQLLYCGRFEQEQKRVLDLVQLARVLNQRGLPFQISLAGSGPADVSLKCEIAAHQLERSFRFLGVLSPVDLALEYRRHDALLITSEWETGPLVAWEAMSHGLPVVSSRYLGSGLEGALVDGWNCLLFEVGDMNAAADAVQAATTPSVRESLVRAGLLLVHARYSRAASIQLWHDALQQVLLFPPLVAPTARRPTAPNSRLDKWFGTALGEQVRRAAGRTYAHVEAGGEWPHAGPAGQTHAAFLGQARMHDAPPTELTQAAI